MKFLEIVIIVIIVGGLLGVVASTVLERTTTQTQIDSFSFDVGVPLNYSLSKVSPVELFTVTNGTGDSAVALELNTNYSSAYFSEGIMELRDNATHQGAFTINYSHNEDVVTGASGIMLLLLTLIVVVGLVLIVTKKTKVGGSK